MNYGNLTPLHRCPKKEDLPPMAHNAISFSHIYPDFYSYYLAPHHPTHANSSNRGPTQQHGRPLLQYLSNMSFLHHVNQVHQAHNVPDADFRETRTAFYLDIELPGVKDKNSITITWNSPRSFVVEGSIPGIDVEGKPAAETDESHLNGSQLNGSQANGDGNLEHNTKGFGDTQTKKEEQPRGDTVTLVTLHERRIGTFSRLFSFMCDVDNKALRAKLRDGLLSIVLPKSDYESDLGWKPTID